MFYWTFIFLIAVAVGPSFADSRYVFLFTSAKERSLAGLERQKARKALADESFRRTSRLFSEKAVSLDEYQQFETASILAALDYEIAELKSKQAAISLDLALSLARTGQRIPLCRRQKQSDENTVSKLLKRPKRIEVIPPLPETPPTGTKIEIHPEPLPEPPPIVDPPEPPPAPVPEPGPKPGPDPDPPEPGPGPNPEPKPPGPPTPSPGPKPPGGE